MNKDKEELKNEHENHVLRFKINNSAFKWHQQYVSGAEIRKLGNIPTDDEIFLSVQKPWEDELITDETKVNLARPEIEHFFSQEKHGKVMLIVNLKEKQWDEKSISFDQVLHLAYGISNPTPEQGFTVTYDRGSHQNPEGTMIKGESVFVKNKMIFNAKQTDKS